MIKYAGSFRDPSGFIFTANGCLCRQVNALYKEHYDHLMGSGLYDAFVENDFLIPHSEIDTTNIDDHGYKIIAPTVIEFVSYPYEWCFSQLKDAALLTLSIQKMALEYGMVLKDASAFNIQFQNSKPIFIDTLSFEIYQEGQPWIAYKQFCQHFLAPLAIMAHVDARLGHLLQSYIDGIPLSLAKKLIPFKKKLNAGIFLHLCLHAKMQEKYSNVKKIKNTDSSNLNVSKNALLGIISSLQKTISKIHWNIPKTEWIHYYQSTNYSDVGFEEKKEVVRGYLARINPGVVWDIGANTGCFSRIASSLGATTIAMDMDIGAVEWNYRQSRKKDSAPLTPLVVDIASPTPGLGWHGAERESLIDRGPADCVLALAIIHHLVITNNVPLNLVASFLAAISRYLIIEFVPKNDSQVQRMLANRVDIFNEYTIERFESECKKHFEIMDKYILRDSDRVIFLMKNISAAQE